MHTDSPKRDRFGDRYVCPSSKYGKLGISPDRITPMSLIPQIWLIMSLFVVFFPSLTVAFFVQTTLGYSFGC